MKKLKTKLGQILVPGKQEESTDFASGYIKNELLKTLSTNSKTSVALAGGRTPKAIYEKLKNEKDIDYQKIKFFFGDERSVEPQSSDSNYQMAMKAFLEDIQAEHVFRMKAESNLKQNAIDYEKILEDELESKSLDLCLLGLGNDGHIASLFPASSALEEENRFVLENYAPALETWRMTLTFPAIFAAKKILLLVFGQEKALIIKEALEHTTANLPIQRLRKAHEKVQWIIDSSAAKEILA